MFIRTISILIMLISSQASFALYGAKPVPETSEFSFVGSLHLRDDDNRDKDFFCSAVLVSPTIVLTAGHCLEGEARDLYDDVYYFQTNPQFLKVKFAGKFYDVKRTHFTQSYFEVQGPGGEDVALIELTTPVTGVRPVKIFSGSYTHNQPMKLLARGKQADTKLLKATKYSTATVLETDGSVSGTCGGDSGGAMVTRVNNSWALVGILTYSGEKMCEKRNTISYGPRAHF